MKPVYQFRARALNPPVEGRPNGTLTLCVVEDGDLHNLPCWRAVFDSPHLPERLTFDGKMSFMEADGRPAELPSAERELGKAKVVAIIPDEARLKVKAGRTSVPSFELYGRLPVSADQIRTVTATAFVVPNARPR